MKTRYSTLSILTSGVLLCGAGSHAAILTNGNLSTVVSEYTGDSSSDGTQTYQLTSPNVTRDGTINDTGINENQWFDTDINGGFLYDATGGNGGGGGFIKPITHTLNPRAVLQFANDGKATKGLVNISIDVLFENTHADTLFFNIELYAWNSGDVVPSFSIGGGTANTADYNMTNLGDADTLIDNVVLDYLNFSVDTWTTTSVAAVNLGTGYDFYVWRIGVIGAQGGDHYAFDNLTVVPESATYALLAGMLGLGYVISRRR